MPDQVWDLGIDPGMRGGFALLDPGGSIAMKARMPVREIAGKNQVDPFAVAKILGETFLRVAPGEVRVTIENTIAKSGARWSEDKKGKGRKGVLGFAKGGYNLGILCGVVATLGRTFFLVEPDAWQREMLGRFPRGESKIYALVRAKREWPKQDWRATELSKTPHDGIVDAALIAKWRKNRG